MSYLRWAEFWTIVLLLALALAVSAHLWLVFVLSPYTIAESRPYVLYTEILLLSFVVGFGIGRLRWLFRGGG